MSSTSWANRPGLTVVPQSDDACFDPLHAYFLERLVPQLVAGLVLADTGPHMRGHGDVDAILLRINDNWGEELRAAVLDRSF